MSLHESMAEAAAVGRASISELWAKRASVHPNRRPFMDRICRETLDTLRDIDAQRDALDHAENLTRSCGNAEPTKSEATVNQQAIAIEMSREVAVALGRSPNERGTDRLALAIGSGREISEEEHRVMDAANQCETDA